MTHYDHSLRRGLSRESRPIQNPGTRSNLLPSMPFPWGFCALLRWKAGTGFSQRFWLVWKIGEMCQPFSRKNNPTCFFKAFTDQGPRSTRIWHLFDLMETIIGNQLRPSAAYPFGESWLRVPSWAVVAASSYGGSKILGVIGRHTGGQTFVPTLGVAHRGY